MRREVADVYLQAARRIARSFSAKDGYDALGYDREDYAADLALQAFVAWRAHGYLRGFGSSSERSYVYQAMWNRARQLRQMSRREKCQGSVPLLWEVIDETDLEARVCARQELESLGKCLRGWQRDLLVATALGESGNQYAAARGWHHSRLSKARQKALKILRRKIDGDHVIDL